LVNIFAKIQQVYAILTILIVSYIALEDDKDDEMIRKRGEREKRINKQMRMEKRKKRKNEC
jgi:hypothetical protein